MVIVNNEQETLVRELATGVYPEGTLVKVTPPDEAPFIGAMTVRSLVACNSEPRPATNRINCDITVEPETPQASTNRRKSPFNFWDSRLMTGAVVLEILNPDKSGLEPQSIIV